MRAKITATVQMSGADLDALLRLLAERAEKFEYEIMNGSRSRKSAPRRYPASKSVAIVDSNQKDLTQQQTVALQALVGRFGKASFTRREAKPVIVKAGGPAGSVSSVVSRLLDARKLAVQSDAQ